ncbi:MAG: DUF1178 domain-containing protein [Polaromonas sp.]|nr:DUF1178 domain-containing protein [Polaromonas sp.]
MKVLNLTCQRDHSFEGWFGSESDFQDQLQRGLLTCPLCGDAHVVKLPSAPRLNLKGGTGPDQSPTMATKEPTPTPTLPSGATGASSAVPPSNAEGQPTVPQGFSRDMQAVFLKALREVMAHTEDVGDRFPEQARRMHHGELEPKAIRGEATLKETLELLDEGIDVVPIPLLSGTKNTLQ